ncbi:MAG TPA: methyltransferase domain-containing protein [Polyangiaceae bacterium]|nr:methyltransferase domain-containing protein [Polyangiaceae bacterium]
MTRASGSPGSPGALAEINRQFYDPLWARSHVVSPERFNTWPLVCSLLATSPSRLEVAPGLNPRLPIAGTRFVDMSEVAVAKLVEGGADAVVGLVGRLPCPDAAFDLIGAFDIVEHVDDDSEALSELSRVAAPGAILLLSVPLHASRWTRFDELVGHGRRYQPDDLVTSLARFGWSVEQSGVYGMQPRSSRVADFVVWSFEHRRHRAIWWYSRVILPLGVFFQRRLELGPGMIDVEDVDEVLLVCRRSR